MPATFKESRIIKKQNNFRGLHMPIRTDGLSFNPTKTTEKWIREHHIKKPCKINLGSGGDEEVGWINLDQVKGKNVQVVHNLNKFPYPFKNESTDVIYMSHVLEHLDEPLKVIAELHRILKKPGLLIIRVPHYAGNSSWIDLTHRRPYSILTLKGLSNPDWCRLYHMKKFSSVKSKFGFWKKWFYPWNYIIEPCTQLQPIYFEAALVNIFPPFEVVYIIEK